MRSDLSRIRRRNATAHNVIFILEETLKSQKSIQIYNAIRRNEPTNTITKKDVKVISTGKVKVFPDELNDTEYAYYLELQERIITHLINSDHI